MQKKNKGEERRMHQGGHGHGGAYARHGSIRLLAIQPTARSMPPCLARPRTYAGRAKGQLTGRGGVGWAGGGQSPKRLCI
jgi:hypothetical protein